MEKNQKTEYLMRVLRATAGLTGTELNDIALEAFVHTLMPYPVKMVAGACERVAKEATGRLTLAAIMRRLNGGYRSVEDAYAQMSAAREDEPLITCAAELNAWFDTGAATLFANRDNFAARKAFEDRYLALVHERMAAGAAPDWRISAAYAGYGGQSREHVATLNAEAQEKLTQLQAQTALLWRDELPRLGVDD